MKQHEATKRLAIVLKDASDFHDLMIGSPVKDDDGTSCVLFASLGGTRLSVTVEILSSPHE